MIIRVFGSAASSDVAVNPLVCGPIATWCRRRRWGRGSWSGCLCQSVRIVLLPERLVAVLNLDIGDSEAIPTVFVSTTLGIADNDTGAIFCLGAFVFAVAEGHATAALAWRIL